MRINDTVKTQIINLYQLDNKSIASIYRLTGVSDITISKILRSAGITIRRQNYQALPLDADLINDLYDNQKKSTYELGIMFNCSDETIRKLIRNLRTKSERNIRTDKSKQKISNSCKEKWREPEYIEKVKIGTSTPAYKEALRTAGLVNYGTSIGKWIQSIESKSVLSKKSKERWDNADYRAKQQIWYGLRAKLGSDAMKLAMSQPLARRQWLDKLRVISANRATSGWISSAQKQFYYLLNCSGIEFYEEGIDTRISPFYIVDCIIKKQQSMQRSLIVEIQGEWCHSRPESIVKDKRRATYIHRHTDYDLLYLNDLELSSFKQVSSKLLSFGLTIADVVCKSKQLEIRHTNETDAQLFYSIFHYTGTIRKGATAYGAYFNNSLVAAISYCYPLRTETATRLGYQLKEVMEISRLARQTNVVCKNLASYLIGQTRKLLPESIKCIVSFSDTNYGHTGVVYKACGFINDGIVAPDYYYVSMLGRFHKKTIWDRSKRMKMSESDYAKKHGLLKIYGKEKTRWIYHR